MSEENAKKYGLEFEAPSFEFVARSFLILLGILYSSGYLIQTAHLSKYGIFDFTAIKAQNILTGALAWVPVVVPIVVLFSALTLVLVQRKKNQLSKADGGFLFYVNFLFTLSWMGAISFVLMLLIPTVSGVALLRHLNWTQRFLFGGEIIGVYASLAFMLFAMFLWNGKLHFRKNEYAVPKYVVLGCVIASSFMLCRTSITYLLSFADTVYPATEIALGGGKAVEVELVLDEECPLGLIERTSDGRTVPILLHGQSESCFLVSSKGEESKFIQIQKDQVIAIQLAKAPPFFRGNGLVDDTDE